MTEQTFMHSFNEFVSNVQKMHDVSKARSYTPHECKTLLQTAMKLKATANFAINYFYLVSVDIYDGFDHQDCLEYLKVSNDCMVVIGDAINRIKNKSAVSTLYLN